MAMTHRIEPVAGLLYDPEGVGVLSNVVAPPYDLIDKARQEALYARSLYNVVRLELNRDPDRYGSAARTLGDWHKDGVLKRATRPAIYLYSQFFELEGRLLRRDGFIVRIRLEEFSAGRILPHERTFPAAKQDRLELLTALNTNVSPVFGLYAGAHPALASLTAELTARYPPLEVPHDPGPPHQFPPIQAHPATATIPGALHPPR